MNLKPTPPLGRPGRRWAPILGAFLLLSLANPSATWAAVPANAGANAQKLLQYTNGERSAREMNSLSRSGSLDSTAQRWADHLASEARMYHSSDPAKGSGFNWRAENLAYWEGSEPFAAEKIHSWWMNSKVHRNNIVHPGFTHVGFGMACEIHNGVPWVFAVAHFGGPSGPVQNSGAGQASGGGSTTGMTCTGGSDPPPPSTAAAEPKPSESGIEPESPAADPVKVPATTTEPAAAEPSPSPNGTGKPSSSAATSSEPKARQATASPRQQETQEPNPDGSPSPEAAAAPAEEPPAPAAAQLRSDNAGAAEPANGPLWILAGLVVCAMAVSARRRSRPRPKHAASRRRLPWK
ncbi:MAG: hypothetical protein KY393_01850 [Actinobacteria bacterium]|nr:hypothetical protein [Actinomycetota bacterium]